MDSLLPSSLNSNLLHFILRFSQTSCVTQNDFDASDIERDGDDVASRSRDGRDDGGVSLGKVVEEGGLQEVENVKIRTGFGRSRRK